MAAELPRYCIGSIQIRVGNSNQAHAFALLLEFFVDTGVVTSKNADADDSYGNLLLR